MREIVDRLEPERPQSKAAPVEAIAATQQKSAKWPYLLALAAVVAVAVFLILRPRSSGPVEGRPSSGQPVPAETSALAANKIAATVPAEAETKPKDSGGEDEIVQRVMPQVSPNARRTIAGKIKVRVKVNVDAAGNVTQATLKNAGPSKYFARVALEAARRWEFAPAHDEDKRRTWTLLFAFSRARTEASAARAR